MGNSSQEGRSETDDTTQGRHPLPAVGIGASGSGGSVTILRRFARAVSQPEEGCPTPNAPYVPAEPVRIKVSAHQWGSVGGRQLKSGTPLYDDPLTAPPNLIRLVRGAESRLTHGQEAPPPDPARNCCEPKGDESRRSSARRQIRGRLASSIFPYQVGSSRVFRPWSRGHRPGLSGCMRSNGTATACRPTSTTDR